MGDEGIDVFAQDSKVTGEEVIDRIIGALTGMTGMLIAGGIGVALILKIKPVENFFDKKNLEQTAKLVSVAKIIWDLAEPIVRMAKLKKFDEKKQWYVDQLFDWLQNLLNTKDLTALFTNNKGF